MSSHRARDVRPKESATPSGLAPASYAASPPSTLIRNATILTMNDALDIVDGRGVASATGASHRSAPSRPDVTTRVIDAGGGYLLPGFIQTHVHLCQTLFRGYADDMPLLEWLRRRVWPMEAAHTPADAARVARLAAGRARS